MLDLKSWNKTLATVGKSRQTINWEDKSEMMYWRGTISSDNNTIYSEYKSDRPNEIFHELLHEETNDN
jgi:hypothetical protein